MWEALILIMMMTIITIPLFTLGSINFIAQTLVGPSKCLKPTIQIGLKRVKNPNGRRRTSWLFTSVVEDLNSSLPRTNPASGQGGT